MQVFYLISVAICSHMYICIQVAKENYNLLGREKQVEDQEAIFQ